MSLRPPLFSGRYTLMEWLMAAWFIAGIISLLIGFPIPFIPTDLVKLGLLAVGLTFGIAALVWMPSPEGNQEWNEKMNAVPLPLRRAFFYITVLVLVGLVSAANVYMAVLAAHAATSRSAEITLSVSYKGRDLGVLGKCSHYVQFRESRLGKICISPDLFQVTYPGSRLRMAGSESPLGFRGTSVRQCTPPLTCDQVDMLGGGAIQDFLDILLFVAVACFGYVGWQTAKRPFHTIVLPLLVAIGLAIAWHLVCRYFHVLCLFD